MNMKNSLSEDIMPMIIVLGKPILNFTESFMIKI